MIQVLLFFRDSLAASAVPHSATSCSTALASSMTSNPLRSTFSEMTALSRVARSRARSSLTMMSSVGRPNLAAAASRRLPIMTTHLPATSASGNSARNAARVTATAGCN